MKKKINSQKSTSTVVFSLPKSIIADASSVIVVGDFSEWNPISLKEQKDGSFAVEVEVPLGREYHFRYQVDGSRWENDIAADRYETSPIYGHIENSVLSLIDFQTTAVEAEAKAKTTVKKEVSKAASEVVAKAAAKVATVKKTVETAKIASKAVSKAVTKKADTSAKSASKVVSKVATSVADDLTKIEGIGPKIAELLKADGIETFEKLAKSGVETVKGILENAGKRYQIHNPTTWMAQAKLAAKGDWETLKKWQDELSGGKSK
jgi:predicted flap endonuclease-1-like 5' DNA nuclease